PDGDVRHGVVAFGAARGPLPYLARTVGGLAASLQRLLEERDVHQSCGVGITSTGHLACWITCVLTDPSTIERTVPSPRRPTTIISASRLLSTIASPAGPSTSTRSMPEAFSPVTASTVSRRRISAAVCIDPMSIGATRPTPLAGSATVG